MGKIYDFRLKSPTILETAQDRSWTLIGSQMWRIDPCRLPCRWPSVTLKGGTRGVKFSGGST